MGDYELHHGDCLDILPTMAHERFDFCFLDLPYGVTENTWDNCLELSKLWNSLFRCLKQNAASVFTATMPFGVDIIQSNRRNFRYDLQWLKTAKTGFFLASKRPLRAHENLLVFFRKQPTYNPQMLTAEKLQGRAIRFAGASSKNYRSKGSAKFWTETGKRYPGSYLKITSEKRQQSSHPTQKPIALLEWLIATYTNPGDVVLDPVMGSGTTGHACANLGRRFVGIEKDKNYFSSAKNRIEAAYAAAAAKPAQNKLAI